MSWWVLLRVWETNLFEQSELDWCLPLKEETSHFCTLSDQPVTFNARADWFLSGTADKISGTKLACHSRRSNSRLRRELRERWKNHILFAPSVESEHLEQVTSQTFLSERTISRAPDWLLVCYLANADYFWSSSRLHSRATYCGNMVIKNIHRLLNGDRRYVRDW